MEPTQQLTLHVPVYVWPLVGALVLGWIYALLPEKYKRRSAKPASNYVQLNHDLDLPGPVSAPAKAQAAKSTAATPPPPAQPPQWTLDRIRALDAGGLEDLVCAFWRARSCTIEPNGDQLLISRPSTGRLFAIAQCAPVAPNKVSLDTIQAFWDVTQQHTAPLGLFYGLSGFAPEALAFAKDKHLKLLMGSDLLTEIGTLKPDQQQSLLALVMPVAKAA